MTWHDMTILANTVRIHEILVDLVINEFLLLHILLSHSFLLHFFFVRVMSVIKIMCTHVYVDVFFQMQIVLVFCSFFGTRRVDGMKWSEWMENWIFYCTSSLFRFLSHEEFFPPPLVHDGLLQSSSLKGVKLLKHKKKGQVKTFT